MMMASPTAASPAATVMTKIVKTCPSIEARRWENAIRLMLTAFIISSMPTSWVIMFRRMITPIRPMTNSVPDSIRYASVLGIASGTHLLLDLFLRLHAIDDELRIGFFLQRAQLTLPDEDRADHGHEQKERGDLEWHEVIAIEGHPHRLRISDGAMTHHPASRDAAIRIRHLAHAMRR